MSVRLCYVSVIGLCYILCILQHFVWGGAFFPGHGVCSFCICNYTESKNWATFTFTVTLANVGRFFFNSFNVGIRKKWLITRMQNFPPQLNFVATLPCKTNTSVNVNLYKNAVLLSDAKFKQNMTRVTKS